MPNKRGPTGTKRQRERSRRERQEKKEKRRQQREAERDATRKEPVPEAGAPQEALSSVVDGVDQAAASLR